MNHPSAPTPQQFVDACNRVLRESGAPPAARFRVTTDPTVPDGFVYEHMDLALMAEVVRRVRSELGGDPPPRRSSGQAP